MAGERHQGWVAVEPPKLGWMRVFEHSPLEVIVTTPEVEELVGFLGVYPLASGLLEALVYRGRGLHRLLEGGWRGRLFLNAVTDPLVLWDVFKGRARPAWYGEVYSVDNSYLVMEAGVREFEAGVPSSRLYLEVLRAWERHGYAPPPSRVSGALLDLMVMMTRADILCPEQARTFIARLESIAEFLKRRMRTPRLAGLVEEVLREVETALRRCREIGGLV